ncbi:MAG: BlaI/MecI/CopY family transcriptional regulator [Clostridia bacterium]|nr:BlaI/MecI/CopY family transcriptional regulator [Clostridia bacterium]
MEYQKLCESDYRFMTVIWDNEPVSSTALAALCLEKLSWKKSTTYTMLKKMTEKGLAKNENTVVTSVVSRDRVQKNESELFLTQTFSGSLPGFLAAFLGNKTISKEEADELIRLIEEHKDRKEDR